jgi:hypothetical protein
MGPGFSRELRESDPNKGSKPRSFYHGCHGLDPDESDEPRILPANGANPIRMKATNSELLTTDATDSIRIRAPNWLIGRFVFTGGN